jgi:hypothetical protein
MKATMESVQKTDGELKGLATAAYKMAPKKREFIAAIAAIAGVISSDDVDKVVPRDFVGTVVARCGEDARSFWVPGARFYFGKDSPVRAFLEEAARPRPKKVSRKTLEKMVVTRLHEAVKREAAVREMLTENVNRRRTELAEAEEALANLPVLDTDKPGLAEVAEWVKRAEDASHSTAFVELFELLGRGEVDDETVRHAVLVVLAGSVHSS